MDVAARETGALAAYGEIVWFWHPDAGAKFAVQAPRATVARKPGHRGDHV